MAKKKRCASTGKVMFRHYQQAAKVCGSNGIRHRVKVAQTPQSIYRCEDCDHWHVTSYSALRTAGIKRCVQRRLRLKQEKKS